MRARTNLNGEQGSACSRRCRTRGGNTVFVHLTRLIADRSQSNERTVFLHDRLRHSDSRSVFRREAKAFRREAAKGH